MFPTGHAGLAVAAAWLIDKGISRRGTGPPVQPGPASRPAVLSITGRIDYRLVVLGSQLPDIIDKPLWFFSQGALFPSGRSYAHTFLFSLILLVGGLILLKFRQSGLLTLSLAGFSHLVLDKMWQTPSVLWWPLAGRLPLVTDTTGWLSGMIQPLITQPGRYAPEILGETVALVPLLILLFGVIRRKGVVRFIKTGLIR